MSSKREGNNFENIFKFECDRQKIKATRFPDGCRRVGIKTLIPVKTPWDWIVTRNGRTALIDTKTQAGEKFPCSKITKHQVEELHDHELSGALAGYVIWFRGIDSVVYVPASILIQLVDVRGSISRSMEGVVLLGPHENILIAKMWQ